MICRIGVFSIADTYLFIDEEKLYLLEKLQGLFKEIYIICNSQFPEQEIKKLRRFTNKIYQNVKGYDGNRWKYIILKLYKQGKLMKCDQLVLFNDSFLGPIFDIKYVFDEMYKKQIDFWGITVHGNIIKDEITWSRFLQTYFLVFEKNILSNKLFKKFWKEIALFKDYKEYEEKFEFSLTSYFEQYGFKWAVYSDTTDWEKESAKQYISFYLLETYKMLREKKLPVIPKYLFLNNRQTVLSYNMGNQADKVLAFVKTQTNYNVNLIYDYLIRRCNIYDLKLNLNLNYVLPLKININNLQYKKKVALFVHLFYEDLFDICLDYLKEIPKYIDIYISTDTDKKAFKLKQMVWENCFIEVCNLRGREWAAFLIIHAKRITAYEYFCLIHDKKSSQLYYSSVGHSFFTSLWENAIGSENYVENILALFEDNPQIGIIAPPEVYHGTYFHTSIDYWTICYKETCEILKELNVHVPIDEKKPPITLGSVLWCRRSAVRKLFDHGYLEEAFPSEPMPVDGTFNHAMERVMPYIAQAEGYYTVTVMNDEFARVDITNRNAIMHDILVRLKQVKGINLSTYFEALTTLDRILMEGNRYEE